MPEHRHVDALRPTLPVRRPTLAVWATDVTTQSARGLGSRHLVRANTTLMSAQVSHFVRADMSFARVRNSRANHVFNMLSTARCPASPLLTTHYPPWTLFPIRPRLLR